MGHLRPIEVKVSIRRPLENSRNPTNVLASKTGTRLALPGRRFAV